LHKASIVAEKGLVSNSAKEDENHVALCAGGDSGCRNFSISARALESK
jgi:hypothetical protein